jgi:hypothetical protein
MATPMATPTRSPQGQRLTGVPVAAHLDDARTGGRRAVGRRVAVYSL